MHPAPKKNKDWVKEIIFAISEAKTVVTETEAETGMSLDQRLYTSAPILAMRRRGIDFKKEAQAVQFACQSVAEMHQQYGEFKAMPKRSFAHAYLDTHLYFKLLKRSKCQEIIHALEAKGVIEK